MKLTENEIEVMVMRLKTWPWKTLRRWYDDLRPSSDEIDERFRAGQTEHG